MSNARVAAEGGWERVAVVQGLTSTDLSANGTYNLPENTFYVGSFTDVASGTLTADESGIHFDITGDFVRRSVGIRIRDVFPDYELGMRLRGVVKFSADTSLISSGENALVGIGYGQPDNLYYMAAGNGAGGVDAFRVLVADEDSLNNGGDGEARTFNPTGVDFQQVVGIQGSHPGWTGFSGNSEAREPAWADVSSMGLPILTAEHTIQLSTPPAVTPTQFDAADDQMFVYMRSGTDGALTGTIEYVALYVLRE